MLYGQIKLADFYENHNNAIIDGLKGTMLGGIIGGLKDTKDDAPLKSRMKNIGRSALIGGVGGVLTGSFFDNNENMDELHNTINSMKSRLKNTA